MFTGIIEEIGFISKITSFPGGKRLKIVAQKVLDDLAIDQSIAISGVCLTVVEIGKNSFTVEAVGETLQKTTMDLIRVQIPVNLERALRLNDRLGGHLIQGHVNGIGKVMRLERRGNSWYLEVSLPAILMKYIIEEGSIALDGVSLTIAHVMDNRVGISVIPYTYKNTTISDYKIGQQLNIETDFMARYIENFLKNTQHQIKNATFSQEWFKRLGF
jgi:riboflavin synthase